MQQLPEAAGQAGTEVFGPVGAGRVDLLVRPRSGPGQARLVGGVRAAPRRVAGVLLAAQDELVAGGGRQGSRGAGETHDRSALDR
ncbi:hypothetical protein [Streptomyces sp. NRRL S-1022]|uniref:hypothetical protein n=1 Tax=Streptomyces sp. NRRL S-1022 TaxID=1463880 RepID=UPI0004C1C2AF|nr:hypothetical protein [Streptomyces sp. NRRL S-1022]